MDFSTDMSDNEAVIDHRLTRVLTEDDVKYIDRSMSSDIESNESYEELKVVSPPIPSPEVAKDMIGKVKGMTHEQVQELLHKLNLTDDEAEEENVITDGNVYKEDEEEINSEHNEQQKKKTQRTQTKKAIKGNTKASRQQEDEASNLENKINKPKVEAKGNKNDAKSSNVDAQLEENPSKIENKKNVLPSKSNKKDENLDKKLKKESSSEALEKKTQKSKNDKVEIDSKKEKQTKTAQKIGNENHIKESASKLDTSVETHVQGRVLRARQSKAVLKELNEPKAVLKELNEPIKEQNKRTGKKQELNTIKSAGNTNATSANEDSKAGPKKGSGKKEVPEIKKIENNPAVEENAVVKVKKTGKKVPTEAKEHEDSVPSTIKEDVKTNKQRKNVKEGITEAVQNIDEGEFVTNVKNTKAKKKPANAAKITEMVNVEQVNVEKAKLKAKPDSVKIKKTTETKENKISDGTIPNKRAAKKK